MNDTNLIEFDCQLWKTARDHEDETKITFMADCSQINKVNSIPAQRLLKISIEVQNEE